MFTQQWRHTVWQTSHHVDSTREQGQWSRSPTESPKCLSTDRSQVLRFMKLHLIRILRKPSHNPGDGVQLHLCIKSPDYLTILKFCQKLIQFEKLANICQRTNLERALHLTEQRVPSIITRSCIRIQYWSREEIAFESWEFFIQRIGEIWKIGNLAKKLSLHWMPW